MPTLDWIGKKAVVNHHRQVPYHLLRCDRELSVGDPDAGNLLVQGDNLLALKALLPYYAGKVKCIYIDPPYNTGNEGWVYNDNVNSPEIRQWLRQTVGREGEDLSRHDKWLCMMYPRLALLRDFLTEDGIIFVSVDENEYRYLALMMDELFGAGNRVETFIWKKSYGGGAKSKHVVNLHEYILCFAKAKDCIPVLDLPPDEKAIAYYKYRDAKYATRGPHRFQPLATNSMDPRPNLRYGIPWQGEEIWPEKQWQWSKDRVLAALADDGLVIAKKAGKWTVSYKQYLKDDEGAERRSKAYSIIEGIYTQQGTNEVAEIFGDGKAFSFPKPRKLLETLIALVTAKDSLILDSFAGSGTTAHAVLAQNKADGGSRRFICIEMDEGICRDVTAPRIRKAIEGYGDTPGLAGGFRFCKLGTALFDAFGAIDLDVGFADLAAHVFFTETGSPIPKRADGKTPLLGVHERRAIYLLFNGVLGDKRPDGGNVLTGKVLQSLPPHDGPRVVYGEACRLGEARLRDRGVIFRQVPWEVRAG
ncbi:MAG: site-specific DNA-methyltransferase [Tepidisphaeraceae bacterium]